VACAGNLWGPKGVNKLINQFVGRGETEKRNWSKTALSMSRAATQRVFILYVLIVQGGWGAKKGSS